MSNYSIHPLIQKAVPETSETDYVRLREGIRKNGLIHPIVVSNREIIDGRTRQRICEELSIEARYEEYSGTLPIAEYILQTNLRRNLTPKQMDAMILTLGREVIPQMRKEAKQSQLGGLQQYKAPSDGNPSDGSNQTQKRFRKLVGQTQRADDTISVLQHEDLAQQVESGQKSLKTAAEEARARRRTRRYEKKKASAHKQPIYERKGIQTMLNELQNGKPKLGLTREEFDPTGETKKLSSREFLDKYGHVQIMTKAELEKDAKQAAMMAWVTAVNELRIPLQKYLQVGAYEHQELEEYIAKSRVRRLAKITEFASMIVQVRESIEWILPILNASSEQEVATT
jgi:hypothetical protein